MRNRNIQCTARAIIRGGAQYPQINGMATFTPAHNGTMVCVRLNGLPPYSREDGQVIGPHGMHIHTDGNCTPGTCADPFPKTGMHYNPTDEEHPDHVGDFPVVFSNNGYAMMSFYTDRFCVEEIIGRSLVIHESPDDYRTQPAGDSGKKIACGVICWV